MPKNYLSVRNISYHLPQGDLLFENVSLDVSEGDKIALIGENGTGKTTLLKIISGTLSPSSGQVTIQSNLDFLPQDVISLKGTVANILGISDILSALGRVETGEGNAEDFEIIGERWDIRDTLAAELESFHLTHLREEDDFSKLSGGEKEKLLLIRMFLSEADILLFDEPTNNLDAEGRAVFYRRIHESKKASVIVSHDRDLLNRMTVIAELSSSGIKKYGGNYDFYAAAKVQEKENLMEKKTALTNETGRLFSSKARLMDDVGKKVRFGKKLVAQNKFSRIVGNALNGSTEISTAKKIKKLDEKIGQNKEEIYDLGLALKDERIKIPLPAKPFIKDRLLELENVSFGYEEKMLFSGIDLVLSGTGRVLIKGANGSGKTTLIKLILGELFPVKGKAKLNGHAVYLTQDLSLVNRKKSIVDNVIEYNKGISTNEAYAICANFKFRNTTALKLGETLSGGELLRASLAMILGTQKQPDLLIFDEPTNNLDIKSTEILEDALCQYQGAMIVVSHDTTFVAHLGITQEVLL